MNKRERPTEGVKICTKCGNEKSVLEFYWQQSRLYLYPYCDKCRLDTPLLPHPTEGTKVCYNCKVEKPVKEFTWSRKRLASYCHKCVAKKFKEKEEQEPYTDGTKTCSCCGVERPVTDFYWVKTTYNNPCKDCGKKNKAAAARRQRAKNAKPSRMKTMFWNTRKRGREQNVPATLTLEDIWSLDTDTCPILGVPLNWACDGGFDRFAPTVDKIIPSLGYVLGNVHIVSARANVMKNDASLEEIVKLGEWAKMMATRLARIED